MDSLLSPACCLKVGNEVFGFARFSKAVQAVQIVFSDGNPGLLDQISAILSTRLQSLIFLCTKITRCVRTQFETTIASIGFKPTCCAAKFRSGDRVIPTSASAFQGRHPPRRGECLKSAQSSHSSRPPAPQRGFTEPAIHAGSSNSTEQRSAVRDLTAPQLAEEPFASHSFLKHRHSKSDLRHRVGQWRETV